MAPAGSSHAAPRTLFALLVACLLAARCDAYTLLPRGAEQRHRVKIYSKSACDYCVNAKAWLGERGVSFDVIDVEKNRDNLLDMLLRSGRKTVPQIFVGNHHIGGWTDLMSEAKAGTLAGRLV